VAEQKPNSSFINKLIRAAQKARPYIPFIVINTVCRVIDRKGKSLLDAGCGDGVMGGMLKNKKRLSIGADVNVHSLKTGLENGTHDGYVLCDVRVLPFQPKSFDTVLAMEVLEHQEKEDALKSIKDWEAIARRQVIITTPVGECRVTTRADNPFDEHKSYWLPQELKRQGYTVRGHGLARLYGDDGWFVTAPRILVPLLYIFSVFVGPVVYFFPGLSGRMVCVKRFDK
jgi:SAM-dependent methyltransferase